jgi:hypothetical protein
MSSGSVVAGGMRDNARRVLHGKLEAASISFDVLELRYQPNPEAR